MSNFNPIKEDKDGVMAKRVIWSTKTLDQAIKGLKEGRKLVANPFYENNIKLLKDNIVFNRTQEEVDEWKKCANDILYFAEKYCVLMTPEGRQHIHLRDYQKKYLLHLFNNRLSVYLSARQSGKCNSLITNVLIKLNEKFQKDCPDVKKQWDKYYYIKENDTYLIPLFEIYNLYDKRFIWKIKYRLYKIIYKLLCLKAKQQKKIDGNVSNSISKDIRG